MVTTTSAYDYLRQRVHARLAATETPVTEEGDVRSLIEAEVESFQHAAMRRQNDFEPLADPAQTIMRLVQDVSGMGDEISQLLLGPTIEEIRGSDGDLTYRTTDGQVHQLANPANPFALLNLCQRWVSESGDQLDASHPRADAVRVFVEGHSGKRQARLSVSIAPRIDGVVSFILRIPQKRNTTVRDLVTFGSITPEAATFLEVAAQANQVKVLTTGPPGGGKTTMIEAWLRATPPRVRVIVCEENRELNAPLLNGDYWATSKVEELPDLVRSARVNSPEMIVLGELKGQEAYDLLMAGNFGTGLVAAVHANTTAAAFESLALAANPAVPAMSTNTLVEYFSRLFEIVIYCGVAYLADSDTYVRQVTEIGVVLPQLAASAGRVAVSPLFQRDEIGAPLKLVSNQLPERLERECNRVLRPRGLDIQQVLNGAEVRW